MKKYNEYKESDIEGVGLIPSHWKKTKTFREMHYIKGMSVSEEHLNYEKKGHKYIRTNDAYENSKIKKEEVYHKTEEKIPYKEKGDLLICFDGFNNKVGKGTLGMTTKSGEGYFSGHMYIIKNKKDDNDKRYLEYILSARYIQNLMCRNANGAISMSSQHIKNDMPILKPPLNEQTQIANYLDEKTEKIDAIIEKKKLLLEKMKDYKQSLISEVVTKGLDPNVKMKDSGIDWIGMVPAHWEYKKLKYIVEKFIDYRGKTPEKVVDGIQLITARNIKNGKVDYNISKEYIREEEYEEIMRRGKPKVGDIIFTTEAPLGEVALVDKIEIALAQRIILFKTHSFVNNVFYKLYFSSKSYKEELRKYSNGTTVEGISSFNLKMTYAILPPIEEQNEMVEFLSKKENEINNIIKKMKYQINLLENYKQSLVSEVVTGKTKVD